MIDFKYGYVLVDENGEFIRKRREAEERLTEIEVLRDGWKRAGMKAGVKG